MINGIDHVTYIFEAKVAEKLIKWALQTEYCSFPLNFNALGENSIVIDFKLK